MKVKLSDIIDAMEETSQDSEFFLDKETGEIIWLNDMIMAAVACQQVWKSTITILWWTLSMLNQEKSLTAWHPL